MTTPLDRSDPSPGYWPSAWPVECGGNRRQKARVGRLDAATGTAEVVTRRNDRWNVMVVERDPGEWFLGGTMPAFAGPPPYGWVERIHPETLEPISSSGELPCGDHVWCGAILAHANGSIHSVNGSYLHRLDPDCQVLAERELPVDRSHNGLLALSDGTLITKDLWNEEPKRNYQFPTSGSMANTSRSTQPAAMNSSTTVRAYLHAPSGAR